MSDTPITWTELPKKSGATMTRHSGTWGDFLQRLQSVGEFPNKDACPWVKLAVFGDKRSKKGSLRTNENMRGVYGVEGDYDGEKVTIEQAVSMLERAGIKAAVYPSPSNETMNPPHSHGGPRWRVMAPCVQSVPPADRKRLLARVNGALGGILSVESFTDSQGYYFGATPSNKYRVVATFGDPNAGGYVDELHALDAGAIGKVAQGSTEEIGDLPSAEKMRVHLDNIHTGKALHDSTLGVAAQLASIGMQRANIEVLLRHAMDTSEAPRDPRWEERYADIPRIVEDAVDFVGRGNLDFDGLTEQAKNAPEARYKLKRSADVAAMPAITWRVRGVLPATGLAAGYGPSASGKSFLFFDMAAAIAEGRHWFGYRVEQAPVIYLVLEGEGGLRVRFAAWEKHNGRALPDSFACIAQPFTLTEPQDLADLLAVVPAGAVVFIDTLNRAAPTADENSSKDMGGILKAAKTLQAKTSGLVVVVHHTGKDATKGLRGHSSLFAALDAAIEVTREAVSDIRGWSVAKSKDGSDNIAHGFALQKVLLSVNEHGEEETSCVIEPATGVPIPNRKRLTGDQKLVLAGFNNADSLGLGVSWREWRDHFFALVPDKSQEAKKQAFARGVKSLVASGEIVQNDSVYRADQLF